MSIRVAHNILKTLFYAGGMEHLRAILWSNNITSTAFQVYLTQK